MATEAESLPTPAYLQPHGPEWCPKVWSRVHDFYDMWYWNGEDHPTCVHCGYVDKTRQLEHGN